ncbi:MAG TPA: chemotaxis protein CheA [Elusimicrobiota bacterium]|nr:chemotaxis protein CheA [Elusimicrobiota bacterium]
MAIDRRALLATFRQQAGETLRGLEESLLALEAHPDDEELVNGLFRGAHRLKGDAALLGLAPIAELTHVFEDLLDRLRHRKWSVTGSMITLHLRFLDVLEELIRGVGGPSAAEAASASGPAGGGVPTAKTVRVNTDKLDRLLDTVGEIAIHREKLRQMVEDGSSGGGAALAETLREADPLYLDLQETVMKARMVPIGPLFRTFQRTVRDLGNALGKKAVLRLTGEEVEVDTAIVENLRDPLTHLIRNAMDHGVEAAEARAAAGKSAEAQLSLSAAQEAGFVHVRLTDDGRGLDRAAIAARVRALGLAAAPEALTDADLFAFLFAPGFSTATKVTEWSGRGVGLDIVRRHVQTLRGIIAVESRPGQSTTFAIRLPLTLAIIQGFSVGVGEETMVIPLEMVAECLELAPGERENRDPLGVFNLRGEPVPLVRLGALWGGAPGPAPARESAVVVRWGDRRAGFVVDRVLGENQTVIKPLPPHFRSLEGVAASSLLGNGRIALVLDVPGIFKKLLRERAVSGRERP